MYILLVAITSTFVFFLNEGSLTWFGRSNPLSLLLRWKGGFDLVVELTGFLLFTGEMAEPNESSEQVEVEEISGADEGVQLIDTITDPSLS